MQPGIQCPAAEKGMLKVRPGSARPEVTIMSSFKIFATILSISLFMIGCNQQPEQQATVETYPYNAPMAEADPNDYWAKDNLDLQRVGYLLEKSNSPEEFERYLNENDGINNLDLNGDGYADYISVEEFGGRNDRERGLSLYSRFGPEQIQDIASVMFYRDDPNVRGAHILLRGNENIYGDNVYYETNWLDRTLDIVSTLFNPRRDQQYRSPYYYDNYPSYYEPYPIVETPIYQSRVVQLYPEPAFVYTTSPTIQVSLSSPYEDRYVESVYARLAKPTDQQRDFLRNNPVRPAPVRLDKAERKAEKQADKIADKIEKQIDKAEKRAEKMADKQEKQIEKIERKAEKQADKADRGKGQGKGQGKGKGKGKP
jgi:hypothetical protein